LQNMCVQFEKIIMEYSFKTKNLISIDKKNEAIDFSVKNWSQHKNDY
jgi:hypothetical protein